MYYDIKTIKINTCGIFKYMETNRYKLAKIYKLTDIGGNKAYIGSTVKTLAARLSNYITAYTRYLESKVKNSCKAYEIFNEVGVENCKIELIELYPCSSLNELMVREG